MTIRCSQNVKYVRRPSIVKAITIFIRSVAPVLVVLAFSSVAHAQGTIDFSGAQTFMTTVKTFAMFAGAIVCLIGLIFAAVGFMGGRIQQGVMGLVGVIFGAGVLGWGSGWIASLTGQSVQ